MTTHKPAKKPNYPPNIDTSLFIADVPVQIAVCNGDEALHVYDDIAEITYDLKTSAGRELRKRMALTMQNGFSTKDALFSIASDDILTHEAEILEQFANTEIVKRAAGQDIHVHVKRNGDITYKMPMKE